MIYLLIGVVLISLGFIIFMALEAKQNNLIQHVLAFEGFPKNSEPFSIFFISDIHRRKVSKQLIQQVIGKASVVVIGGDIMERGVPLNRVEKNLDLLAQIGPMYFVWGNHDHEVDEEEELYFLLIKKNVIVLNNETKSVKQGIYFVGVDDATYEQDDLDLALKNCPNESFRILLSHNPCIKYKLRDFDQISLILSGHTHGGQIRLFGLGIREIGGIKKLRKEILIISNGYGTTRYPLRLGAPPDTLLINLISTR